MTIGLSAVSFTACDDISDLINEVEFNRLFCPTELEARVQNTTGVKLTWETLSAADAKSYAIELYADDPDMNFSGTPLTYTATASPYSISGLEGETVYSVRVKTVGDTKESKWASTTFETGTEQIFFDVPASDIGKTYVTLSWPAGYEVTTITAVKSGEVFTTHNITAEEKAAGKATVEGLNVESTYTFYIYNGEKQRGKIKVTTLPNYTPVTAEENLQDILDAAEDGETIMLTDNAVYDYTGKALKINKSVVLKSNNNATLKGCNLQIYAGSSLEFANIILDGTEGSGDQAFTYKDEGNYASLYIHDCEVKNFTKGFFYINVAALVDNITISNCLIHDIECSGGDMFDSRAGGYNTFNITENTIYNCAAKRDFIRMDDASSSIAATPVITVDHNTLYNVGAGDANYRLLYVRFAGNVISWTNNVVANTNHKRGFSNQKSTGIPTFKNNFYFNTVNLVKAGDTADATIQFFDEEGTEVATDPFKDAANGDFTIVNETIKDKEAGASRWRQ